MGVIVILGIVITRVVIIVFAFVVALCSLYIIIFLFHFVFHLIIKYVTSSTHILTCTPKMELRVVLFPERTEFGPRINWQEIIVDRSGYIISFFVTLWFPTPLIAEACVHSSL